MQPPDVALFFSKIQNNTLLTLNPLVYKVLILSPLCAFSDKKLLAQGPGETLVAAEEEAARVALRKLYGYTESRKPLDFSPQPQQPQRVLQSVSSS